MSEPADRPLLTFAVASCNQEPFVREAVEAAFAQTYSPLQIILSDDCSDDRSFDIMREMAAAYRGSHEITLNRNPVRKSIGGHFNKVVEMARGELIVIAAADDVSLPRRTQVVYEAWERSGKRATSIHSDFIQINENGEGIDRIYHNEYRLEPGQALEQRADLVSFVQTLKPMVVGCTHAFCRSLFGIFGDMPDRITHEDDVLAFRSVLAAGLLYVNEPLVKYRLHGANMYLRNGGSSVDLNHLKQQEHRLRRDFRNRETMYEAFLLDLDKARQHGLIGMADFEKTVRETDRLRGRLSLMGQFLESGLFRKCRILLALQKLGMTHSDRSILVKRLIPRFLFLRIRLVLAYARLARNRSR